MHDKGLIHRNIKPEALLLNQKGEVVLGSFGIVVRTDNVPEDIVGTPSYMAPEQVQGKAYFATDQYALGILVYEWLSGTLPFHHVDPIEMVVQQVFHEPPSLRAKVPSIPQDVEQVVRIALTKDPQQRFKSVKAFANALEQAAQSG